MCEIQGFFNSLHLNRIKAILDQALTFFGQHVFKEDSYYVILDLQALGRARQNECDPARKRRKLWPEKEK